MLKVLYTFVLLQAPNNALVGRLPSFQQYYFLFYNSVFMCDIWHKALQFHAGHALFECYRCFMLADRVHNSHQGCHSTRK